MAIGLMTFPRFLLACIACLLLLPSTVLAINTPPKPTDIPVIDQTKTLSSQQINQLATMIAEQRASTGNQIGVLMIPSLDGEPIENYSLAVAREWGIGTKERNSGVLLVVVKNDRKLRIEVGYGLEGALTDIRSGQIIRDRITPEFKQGKYFEGLQSGLTGIITAIQGESDPNLSNSQTKPSSFPFEWILYALFFGGTWLSSILARTKSWWAGGVVGVVAGIVVGFIFGFMVIGFISILLLSIVGLLFDRAVSKNYSQHAGKGESPSWWAGGAGLGGGGGSGGFGGFGGGGFGGGGASGDW